MTFTIIVFMALSAFGSYISYLNGKKEGSHIGESHGYVKGYADASQPVHTAYSLGYDRGFEAGKTTGFNQGWGASLPLRKP